MAGSPAPDRPGAPRILVLASRPPYPMIGPATRIFHSSRYLGGYYQVDLLYLNEGPADPAVEERLGEVFSRVYRFCYPRWRFRANALRGLASRQPLQVHYYQFPEVARWLEQNLGRYRAAVANHVRMAGYLKGSPVPAVIDLHDALSLGYARAIPYSHGARRLLYQIEQPRVLRYERDVLRVFRHCLLVSPADRDFLAEQGARVEHARVVPIAVQDRVLARPPYQGPERRHLVFLGRTAFHPNEDAVCFFAREVLPLIRARHPDIELLIVGAEPPPRVQALARTCPGVTVTGYVEDPYGYMEQALMVVAPIRFGAGLQNKVLEAMALAKAVVTTPLCAAPFGARHDEHVLLATGADDTAAAVLALASDPGRRRALGERAAQLVRGRYTTERMGEGFRQAIVAASEEGAA